MDRRLTRLLLVTLLVAVVSPAYGQTLLTPPVDAPVVRAFDIGAEEWSSGHRGVDYRIPRGTAVRAVGPGTVSFAGEVAGGNAVTIDHGGGLQTTYTWLSDILVTQGQQIDATTWIGHSGDAHEGIEGLHLGALLAEEYVDPIAYLGPLDQSAALHLAPLRDPMDVGTPEEDCTDEVELPQDAPAPNDNIAVAIAGIGTKTEGGVSADMIKHGPKLLGYPKERVYDFSYAGTDGPRFHRPYSVTDSSGSLVKAAAELGDLMEKIARKHPGTEVDLIAHSQGGIVARAYLEGIADGWSTDLPPVEHFVTLATPHKGAPLANEVRDIEDEWLTGGLVLDGLSNLMQKTGWLPDPRGAAVGQLRPDSALISWLAREDLVYGTRGLTLAMPHDFVVPADHALLDTETTRILRPEGLSGHSAIVRSPIARGVVHAFLRDAPIPCKGLMDSVGPWAGRLVGALNDKVSNLYGAAESAAGGLIGKGFGAIGKAGRFLKRIRPPW